MSLPVYVGLFLTTESRKNLLDRVMDKRGGLSENVYADHITLKFKPNENDMLNYINFIGKKYSLKISEMLQDDKGMVIKVDSLPPELRTEQNPHITISTIKGVKPVYSNDLLRNGSASKHDLGTLILDFIVDTYPRSLPIQ